jgi:CheY-like chemotaxis protein
MKDEAKRILVIEDELPLRTAIVDTLKQHGFVVQTSDNGKDGLALALHNRPHLIVLDIFMPQMDGLSLLKTLRDDEWGHDVPVIILTNLNPDSDQTIHAVMDQKPAFYLIKANVTLEGIVSKIKEVLDL